MKISLILVLISVTFSHAFAQTCLENAKIVDPVISENTRKVYEEKLKEAIKDVAKSPNDADAKIWLGRRNAYLGSYKKSIEIFTEGIKTYPKDARFYRHRGHRYITIRCFDDAIKDFEIAAKLVKGKKDEIEPDGLPNAKNTPTSTLQSNIFYHLGLAYYVRGDFTNALKAYKNAVKVSTNPDMLVASKHWEYITLRRLGKRMDAERSVKAIGDDLEIIENDDYYKLIKLYQGKVKPEGLMRELVSEANTLSNASLGYGVGNWFLYNGDKETARTIFQKITTGNQWASFGFIASEADLNRDLN